MLCCALLFTFLLKAVTIRGTATEPLYTTGTFPDSTGTTAGPPLTSGPFPNHAAECQRPTLPENVVLPEESFRQKTFSNGSTVKLTCQVGYKPANFIKKSIQCLGGQWTDSEFRCQKKSCGSLPDIPNGRYLYKQGIEYGANVTAECNPGYHLFGPTVRLCRADGWSGRHPQCEVKKCPEPPKIENGGPEEEVFEYYEHGQSVTYKCNKGFDMIGTATVTCSVDGTFHPSPPKCSTISCERPDIPHATRIEGRRPPYKHRSFVRYQCDHGYRMNGSDYMVCEEEGWRPLPPHCEVVTCRKPSDIGNGRFNDPPKDLYNYGEAVTYSCLKGFKLKGASKISCSDDGIFQPPPPQCEVVTCQKPSDIDNVRFNGTLKEVYDYGEAVTYSCVKGFKLQGAPETFCSDDGIFRPHPRCEVAMCRKPSVIDNGRFNDRPKDLYNYGEAVTYSCVEGFKLKGASKIFCSDDGLFQPPPPRCEAVICDAPDKANGQILDVKESPYSYNSRVRYSCDEGYKPQGDLVCKENGWNPPHPQCIKVTCQRPPDIHYGQFNPSKEIYEDGQAVTYSCMTLFRLQGAPKIFCIGDGTFHPPPPKCEVRYWIFIIFIIGFIVMIGVASVSGHHAYKNKHSTCGYPRKVAIKMEEGESLSRSVS